MSMHGRRNANQIQIFDVVMPIFGLHRFGLKGIPWIYTNELMTDSGLLLVPDHDGSISYSM